MTSLSFSLAPEALVRLHNALICLSKFSHHVSIEAEYDLLRLSALNLTKTAYAGFALDADEFFQTYIFGVNHSNASTRLRADKFSCQIDVKTLLSVFKGRTSGRDKDTAVERCEVELHEDVDETECRLVIRMICGLGVIRSYKLTYEPTTVQHATFDRSNTTNQWCIEPKFLKEITDHFSLSAEQLDIFSAHDKAIFTSYTTKITDGKEILKQPVHTSVAIEKKDFEHFLVEDSLHVVIHLKDFKAVIAHAEAAGVMITARYTNPCRPLQFAYDFAGVKTEFTLMTTGESDASNVSSSSRAAVPQLSARQTPAPVNVSQTNTAPITRQMPPPRSRSVRPLTGNSARGTAEPSTQSQRPPASINFDSLFVPADDDRQWDVSNEDERDETEDMLGWDATTDQETFSASMGPRLRDIEPSMPLQEEQAVDQEEATGIPPTQRMSQVSRLHLDDNPAGSTTRTNPNHTSTAFNRQRNPTNPALHISPSINIRSTITMLSPPKSNYSLVVNKSQSMLTPSDQFTCFREIPRWELAAIIAAPCHNRIISPMYINTMPTSR
ncbi:putative DNA repair protein rad9 [Aspergillus candidus]|uniref:Rad9-domain-containing protein n=1 Tax=Aspergillus candidus TaxID=41067 RepID=A0A2I2FAU2_ASPCN|nr:Rad9-domain-containing protein [Aspergillus candidus]PLB37748.1 Rad9-domain-containing protein [Aspergillus candidus]